MSKLENQENSEPKKKKPRGTPFLPGNKFGCGSRQKTLLETLWLTTRQNIKMNHG